MRTTPRSSPASVERVFASTGAAFASRAGVLHGKMSSLDYLDLCRLCLVKDRVSVPIFEGEGDVRQIFLKITACLPVKVDREDKLPKKICDDCVYKVELFYQFWNTSVNAEKQLLQWLGEVGLEEKTDYVTNVLNQNVMKSDPSGGNRLDGSMLQQVSGHQNNMGMGMMDNISLSMPMMISTTNQQQITSVPMDTSGSSVQEMPGTSTQSTHEQITQSQTNTSNQHEEEEESSEEEENSEDECDGEEGLPVKEESEEDPNNSRVIEPTTFVNVSLACDEAGPSGLQQQKVTEMPEMAMQQSTDGDPKSGCNRRKHGGCTMELSKRENDELENIENEEIMMNDPLRYSTKTRKIYCKSEIQRNERDTRYHSKCPSNRKYSTIYQCDVCGKKFRKKFQLHKHKYEHENKSEESMEYDNRCEECDRVFLNEKKLHKHMIKAHQQEKPYQCALCGKCFKTEEFLKTHLKQHNKRFTCDICGVSKVSGYDLRLHKKKHNQEYVTHCEICGKGFYTNQTLERHLLTHTGEKPFICKICNTPYASAAYLNMHIKSHGQREKHKCNICNFESYWKAALKVHLKIHSGENQITCEICGKSVSSKTYLQIHMRIHSGEKPHVCEVCGKAFSVRKYLVVHLRTHTGEKPYECKVCQKRFTQQGSLNSHMKSHSESK
ncbi:zinc finger protein 2-like isoform X11 [Vespula pensylvanica]|uniref:zinc finger protein 2-like isoform X11 n=1 Tax=Vespula pensylvanica TaxID=30213 RepID=UPI001CBA3EA8|nr:zinc finger protein 2-like isoform X11 [Vespula pensylvanica]